MILQLNYFSLIIKLFSLIMQISEIMSYQESPDMFDISVDDIPGDPGFTCFLLLFRIDFRLTLK